LLPVEEEQATDVLEAVGDAFGDVEAGNFGLIPPTAGNMIFWYRSDRDPVHESSFLHFYQGSNPVPFWK
jgi:hypothetical protein